ncbi:MFS transporter [Corynebacterium sp. 3HC-13]|uniref:MFS transporter n=1 Tax=Corynebacterium poyangense TaxID=2684405 RepID=UPI001CCA82B8|nr:MFS transporter [Corynebacterium poyangense]MBZ8178066.1 MFS transporter [Corynebacterium poyangense]
MTKVSAKAAVPILLITFIFSLVIDNGFKFMSLAISQDLSLNISTASLQATLAGIVIGIGAVVYAALADSFPIRNLLNIGLILIAVGSIIGFLGQHVWTLVLMGRLVQTCGLAAAETLYVIYVTKHLPEKDQKTYLGFSTSAFQLAMLFGTLTSGFIATYVSWTAMFLVSLLALLAIPVVTRKVPVEAAVRGNLDLFGLLYVATIATSVMFFMTSFKWIWVVVFSLALILFILHVLKSPTALVKPEFFSNQRYVWALITVAVVYSTQLGLTTLVIPYAVKELHNLNLDTASLLMAPGYAAGALLGALSGYVAKVLNSRQTMVVALSLIVVALLLIAIVIDGPLWVIVFAVILFSGGFATMYAPLVNSALQNISAEKTGVAIGFYNLTINIAIPVGISYTAALIDSGISSLGALSNATTTTGLAISSVTWILAVIAASGMAIYFISDFFMSKKENASRL